MRQEMIDSFIKKTICCCCGKETIKHIVFIKDICITCKIKESIKNNTYPNFFIVKEEINQ